MDDQDLEPYNGEQDLEDDGHVPVDEDGDQEEGGQEEQEGGEEESNGV